MTEKSFGIGDRAARATDYFEGKDNLNGQRGWYSRKATWNKKWSTRLGFLVIAAGAFTSIVQLWAPTPPDAPVHWVPIATALLGAVVILAKGAERIWLFEETWVGYRQASESMKREFRLYVNGADQYAGIEDEAVAYRLFVGNVEEVIAAEQRAFWRRVSEKKGAKESATPAPSSDA